MELELINGDCLKEMNNISDKSIGLILTDLPYGTTKCKWDIILPFDKLWKQFDRIIQPKRAIALHCTQPFTSVLVNSNLKRFKYCWVWDKLRGKGHLVSKIRPMQQTEEIAIFGKGKILYNAQTIPREKVRYLKEGTRTTIMGGKINREKDYGEWTTVRQPTNVLKYGWPKGKMFHPTQKPVELLEYLIQTYTNIGDTVLDCTMGSGSTGVACINTERNFIGIELDKDIFNIAERRVKTWQLK